MLLAPAARLSSGSAAEAAKLGAMAYGQAKGAIVVRHPKESQYCHDPKSI